MELSLSEWLGEHKAAEYEATLRAEGCESVEDLVDSGLTEQHLSELGLKLFAKIRVWGAIQALRQAKQLQQLGQPPTPPASASVTIGDTGDAPDSTSRLHSKVPRFNRSDPSARTLTWSQASQDDWRPQTRRRSQDTDGNADAEGRPSKAPRHNANERSAWDAMDLNEETPDSRDGDDRAALPASVNTLDGNLVRLKGLYEKQLITREVYEAKQKELLNQLMEPPLSTSNRSQRSGTENGDGPSSDWDGDTALKAAAIAQNTIRQRKDTPPAGVVPTSPIHAAAATAVAAAADASVERVPQRRNGDRWGRSKRKMMASQESRSVPSVPVRSAAVPDHHTQTEGASIQLASSCGQTTNSVPATDRHDRWSRSRRRAEASQSSVPTHVANPGTECRESVVETCASPVHVGEAKSAATQESDSCKASADPINTTARPASSLRSGADDQQIPGSDDSWWDSSSGSDTEDLRENGDDSSSLRALHASATTRSQRGTGSHTDVADAETVGTGDGAAAATGLLRDALAVVKVEIDQHQPHAHEFESSSERSRADGTNDIHGGLASRVRDAGASVGAGAARQRSRSQSSNGASAGVASPQAPAAEQKAREEVQAAAASAPGGRIFTGMSFAFLLDRDGLQLGKGRQLIFSNRIREFGGLVYDQMRPDSTTHIVTGKRHDHRKLLGFLSGMGVDANAATSLSVVCCDWITHCLKLKKLVDETDYLSDLSCRLRPYAWKLRQQRSDAGAGALSVLNALTAGARAPAVLTCTPAVQHDPASEEGVSDRVSVKLREEQLKSGDRQKLSDIRPSSRYSKVADLDSHNSSTGDSERGVGATKQLSVPPTQMSDISTMKFVRVPVTWKASGRTSTRTDAAQHAELVGPIEKLQGLWQLAKRWQEQYWQQPCMDRKVETDFPYPLACFTRGRTDGHLNFEHDSMLGSDVAYGQGTKPAVLIVIDPQEYEAYHGHWPHHLFFLLPQSNRGIGYARQVFKEFALSGRAVQDQTKLAFPFYYEIDDLMYNFRELVRDENGVKQFSTESRPNLLRSMLSLQRLPDLQKYGLLGLGRDRGPIAGKSNEFAVNSMSIYKFRLINVDLTRNVHYIQQLKKFEDIAFNYQLLKDGGGDGSYIPTFKSFKFVARAALRSGGGAAAGRQRMTHRCQPEDLLESGTQLDQLCAEQQQVVHELVQWVRDKQDEDVRRAKRRQDAILAAAANGGVASAAAPIGATNLSDDEDEDENDDQHLDFARDGFAALTSNLFVHQKSAVRWLVKVEKTPGLRGGILADEMGLGKTITLLALIAGNTPLNRRGSRLPTLVVLPLSLLNQWAREIRTHTHGLKTLVYYGDGRTASAAQTSSHEIVLTTYDVLVNDDEWSNAEDALSQETSQDESRGALHGVKWHRVVCDEAAFIKNLDTQRAKAVHRLEKSHVWLVTGSPVQNNIRELQTLLRLCKFSGSLVERDWRSLCRHVMLRRTMASVAGEVGSAGGGLKMPKLEEKTITLSWITGQEIETYEKLASKAKAVRGAVHHELLSNVMRMRQACNHPSLASTVDREDIVEDRPTDSVMDEYAGSGSAAAAGHRFALHTESLFESDETRSVGDAKCECAKLAALMKVLDEAKAAGEKVLVFSFFKRFLDLIAVALVQRNIAANRIVRLHGSMPALARDAEVQRFRTQPTADIFLISTKAGGLGLNLTDASTVVILEPGWNPTDEEQAVRRAYRIGQLRRVRVVRFVIRNTIEQQVVRLQKEKQTLAASVLTSSELHRMIQHSQAAA